MKSGGGLRNNAWIVLAGVLLSGAAAWASPGQVAQGTQVEVDGPGIRPIGAWLARHPTDEFIETRRALMARLIGVGADEPLRRARTAMDYAAFHLSFGMAPEGLSALEDLPDGLPGAMEQRRAHLELALAAIDTRDRPLTARAAALMQGGGDRDAALFVLVNLYKAGDIANAGPFLPQAVSRLGTLPERLQDRVLPQLLHVAIETGQWPQARQVAERMNEVPHMAGSAAYAYLLGRVAEAGDDLVTAFDQYSVAAAQDGLWGHRGRVALIDLGLRTDTLDPATAREMMQQARRSWSGDAEWLALMQRLVTLDVEHGNTVGALDSLAAIISGRAGRPEAALARQQARSLWTAFYDAGAAGDMSLTAFLAGHQAIARDYRFEPGFGDGTEALADRFLRAGATVVAADEYRETHDYTMVSRDLGLAQAEDARLDSLQLKQAEALLAGGQVTAAAEVLAEGLSSDSAELHDRLNLLRARLHAEQGDTGGVVETAQERPSLAYRRLRAAALFDSGDWARAKLAYQGVVDASGTDVAFVDAVRLLLAAYRDGDIGLARSLGARFPELTGHPQWSRIAQSVTEDAPALLPLRADTAEARVNNAAEVLTTLDGIEKARTGKTNQAGQPKN
jgi:hypothetical protein